MAGGYCGGVLEREPPVETFVNAISSLAREHPSATVVDLMRADLNPPC
jgi:hypothetical protein